MRNPIYYSRILVVLLCLVFQGKHSIAQNLEVLSSYPSVRLNNLTALLADESITVADLQHESNTTGITFSNDPDVLNQVRLEVSELDSLYGYVTYDLGLYLNARDMEKRGEELIQIVYDGLSGLHDKFLLNIFYLTEKQGLIEYQARVKFGNGIAEDNMSESDKKDVLLDCADAGNIFKRQNISINAHYNAQALIVSRFIFYLKGYASGNILQSIQISDDDDDPVPNTIDFNRVFLSPAGFPINLPAGTTVYFFNSTTPKTPRGALIKFILPEGEELNGYRLFTGKIGQDGNFAGYGPPGMEVQNTSLYYLNSQSYSLNEKIDVGFGLKKLTPHGCIFYNVSRRAIRITHPPNDLAAGPLDIDSAEKNFKEEAFNFIELVTNVPNGLSNAPLTVLQNLEYNTPPDCYKTIHELDINKAKLYYRAFLLNGDTVRAAYLYAGEGRGWVYRRLHQTEPIDQYFRFQEGAWREFVPDDAAYLDPVFGMIEEMLYGDPKAKAHLLLDFLGMIPIGGEVFDFINGTWYYMEGDITNAGLSYAGMAPFVGMTVVAGGKWTLQMIGEVGNATKKVKTLAYIDGNKNVVHLFKESDLDDIMLRFENLYGANNIPSNVLDLLKLDIKANPDVLKLFKDKPEAIEAWDMFRKATDTNLSPLRTNKDVIESLADDLESITDLKAFINNPNANLDASLSTWKFCKDSGILFCGN